MKKYMNDVISFWKKHWGSLVAFIILESIIALFIASFVLDKCITLSVMNEWVSLIVGMVAMIMGVISLFLSFYNVEQSNDVQRETVEIMTKVKEEIQLKLNELQLDMNKQFSDIKHYNYSGKSEELKSVENRLDARKWEKIDE